MATKRKARRTAAQKRATAALVRLNKGKRRTIRRKRNPSRAASPYRAVATMTNPIRRRRRRNPIRTVARRRVARRRNPIGGNIGRMVTPALMGAGGALALDVVWSYIPVPATLKAGPLKHIAKAAGAVALSIIAGKVVKKPTAEAMGVGALTVIAHDVMRELVAKFAPGVKMDGVGLYVNGLGYYSAGTPAGGYEQASLPSLANNSVGLYVNGYSGEGLETEAGYVYN